MSGPTLLDDLHALILGREPAVEHCAAILAQLGATLHRWDRVGALPTGRCELVIGADDPAGWGLERWPELGGAEAVRVSITPYGLSGPYTERPADAPSPTRFGLRSETAAALAGAHAAVAALGALRWARRWGRGVLVEVATLEVLAACQGDALPAAACGWLGGPRLAAGRSDRRPAVLPCADGYVQVPVLTDEERGDLARLVALDGAAEPPDPRASALDGWLRRRTRRQVFEETQAWRLPVTPLLQPAEVPTDDQSVARRAWEHDAAGRPRPRSPFRASLGPPSPARARRRGARPTAPLAGVRLLDLGMVWAGPYGARLLAELGAEVVKVEGPARVDGTRQGGDPACRGLYADLNRGKRSLVVDLRAPDGRQALLGLARSADLLLENFSPRVRPNLGLSDAELAAANPRLCALSLPAFGRDGPWSSYVAFGSGLEAVGGLADDRGAGPPRLAEVPYLDYLVGCYGAAGLLAALLQRDRTDRAAYLEIAQRDVAAQLLRFGPGDDRAAERPAWEPARYLVDQHLQGRGLFARSAERRRAGHHLARLPFQLHGVPRRRPSPAPELGADSRQVLGRLAGLEPATIEGLIERSVVGVGRIDEAGR